MALIRRTPLQRGTRRLRPVSAKRIKINKIYSALRKKFLEDHPWDQVVILQLGYGETEVLITGGKVSDGKNITSIPRSTEIHHRKGRGKYLLDTSTWYAVSTKTHDWIHANPAESYEKGWMLPRN